MSVTLDHVTRSVDGIPTIRDVSLTLERGTLNVGAPADVAVLELKEGNFEFLDNYKGTRTGHQRLFPVATVFAGKTAPRA